MAKFIKFSLSKREYLALAEKVADEDIEKSFSYLKKALEQDDKFVDAYIALGRYYNFLGAQELSNTVLFKGLSLHPKDEQKEEMFHILAMNFLDMNEREVAEFYLQQLPEFSDFDFSLLEEIQSQEKKGGFHVVYPHGEDYYEMLIDKAYSLIREHKLDEAIALADEVDPNSKSKDAANHIALVCLMMKNNIDAVIDNAKKMLEENPSSLAVRCTLATAYLMEEKQSEAYAVMEEVLKNDFTKMEEILLVLPILVNLNMHVEVVKYTKRVLENINSQPNTMVWLSQALYNIGSKDEARKVMRKVQTIYGEYSPAKYYLDLYEKEPEVVEYSMTYPQTERVERYKKIHDFLTLDPALIEVMLDSPADEDDPLRHKKAECKELIEWAFIDGNASMESLIVDMLGIMDTSWGNHELRERLIKPDLSFEIMAKILHSLFKKRHVHFFIVARDIFKEITLDLPPAYFYAPPVWKWVIEQGLFDIIFNDMEPELYINRYIDLINTLMTSPLSGSMFAKPKLARLKSGKTIVGVLLCKTYEDDPEDPKPDTISSYEINERTFEKYKKIIFGDDDGNDED